MTPACRRRWSGLLALAAVALGTLIDPGPLAANQDGNTAAAARGRSLTVRLITVGPGAAVWERFGHNALWIEDSLTGSSVAYDYGRFDFAQPGFLPRFIKGRMRYWTAAADARAVLEFYQGRNRSVWVQELNLPPAAREELRLFLNWNVLEENRYYDYDYYRDNCSTRLRDALDLVLDGAVAAQSVDTVPGVSWRFHSDRLLAPAVLAYTGTKFGLGSPTDVPISKWDEMYVPMKLQEYLRTMVVTGEQGETVQLVGHEEALALNPAYAARTEPPKWYLAFLGLGMLWGAVLLFTARAGSLGRTGGRIGFGVTASLWLLFAGFGGALLLFLWLGTDHVMTRANENVLQMNPFAVALLVLLPAAIKRRGRALKHAIAVAAFIAAGSFLGLLLKAMPGFDQHNLHIVLLALPINLAVLLALWRLPREVRGDGPSASAG